MNLINTGTRDGDSGSALNIEENGRFSTFTLEYTYLMSSISRYTAMGVNSWGNHPDVWAKITPDIKKWIQDIAENTQDSDCSIFKLMKIGGGAQTKAAERSTDSGSSSQTINQSSVIKVDIYILLTLLLNVYILVCDQVLHLICTPSQLFCYKGERFL